MIVKRLVKADIAALLRYHNGDAGEAAGDAQERAENAMVFSTKYPGSQRTWENAASHWAEVSVRLHRKLARQQALK